MKNIFLFLATFCLLLFHAQNYAVESIPENLKKNAYAVVRDDATSVTIKAIDEIVYEVSKPITILDKSGEKFSTVFIPYDKNNLISEVKVTILDTKGNVVKKYNKSDFTDNSYSASFSLYDDNRVLYLQHISIQYPYSIQYSYIRKSKNTVFIPDFSPVESYHISTEKTSMKINNTSGIKFRTKLIENDFATLTSSENSNNYSYSYQNIPAIEYERMSPSIDQFSPKVEFSLEGKQGSLTDWKEFGKWYYQNLLAPSSIITPELKAEVAALNLSGTTSEKVKKLYQYMQSKTRYVFVAIGIGGWKPMEVENVRSKG